MLPRKNGKSFLISLVVVYWLLFGDRASTVLGVASTRDQARLIFRMVAFFCKYAGFIDSGLIEIKQNEIVSYRDVSYRVVPSDGDKLQGEHPAIVVCDEIHAWKQVNGRAAALWQSLVQANRATKSPIIIGITTAGTTNDPESGDLLAKLYNLGMNSLKDKSSRFGFFCWAASEEDDWSDPNVWKKANPALAAGNMSMESFQSDYETNRLMGELNSFLRFALNVFRRASNSDMWFPAELWKKGVRFDEDVVFDEKQDKIVLGGDFSRNGDSSAIVGLCVDGPHEGLCYPLKLWERKDTDSPDWHVEATEIDASMAEIMNTYNVVQVYVDNSLIEQTVEKWVRTYGKSRIGAYSMGPKMISAALNFKYDVVDGRVGFREDDYSMRTHLLNAVVDDRGHVQKQSKKSSKKIDIAICAILANEARKKWELRKKLPAAGKEQIQSHLAAVYGSARPF